MQINPLHSLFSQVRDLFSHRYGQRVSRVHSGYQLKYKSKCEFSCARVYYLPSRVGHARSISIARGPGLGSSRVVAFSAKSFFYSANNVVGFISRALRMWCACALCVRACMQRCGDASAHVCRASAPLQILSREAYPLPFLRAHPPLPSSPRISHVARVRRGDDILNHRLKRAFARERESSVEKKKDLSYLSIKLFQYLCARVYMYMHTYSVFILIDVLLYEQAVSICNSLINIVM